MKTPDNAAIAAYYDAMLPRFQADHAGTNARHARVKMDLARLVKPGMRILDLGCGTGITSAFMGGLGAKVMAVDLSPKLLEHARKASAHPNVEYFEGDICDIVCQFARDDVGNQVVNDGIVLADVMEHIPREKLMSLMAVIKHHSSPDTWVYLNIPDARFIESLIRNSSGALQIIDNALPMPDILELFGAVGFEVATIDINGIDRPYQYNAFTFIPREKMARIHGDKK